jgi:hypothetical protein
MHNNKKCLYQVPQKYDLKELMNFHKRSVIRASNKLSLVAMDSFRPHLHYGVQNVIQERRVLDQILSRW